ncbi:hypothetical protein AM218_06920 [Hymenobacter sp. DG25A]|nr:hypothetical protein AM218_06920 [Hymenobacter sp. DG25A]
MPAAAPDTAEQRYYIFDKGTVGRNFIRLNMTEAALLDRVPKAMLKKTTRQLEGIEYPVYELRNPDHPEAPPTILELVGDEEEGYRIWRIQLHDARYRAAQGGVGVGSTYGQARQAYGIQFVERGDMGLVAVSEAAQISWLLDASTLPNPNAPVRRPTDVPDATKIKGVLLFR